MQLMLLDQVNISCIYPYELNTFLNAVISNNFEKLVFQSKRLFLMWRIRDLSHAQMNGLQKSRRLLFKSRIRHIK